MYQKIKIWKLIVLGLIVFLPRCGFTQSIQENIANIAANLLPVEASKMQFNQDLKDLSSGYVVFTISKLDAKGNAKVTNYEFSFADIDNNTVRTITKKDVILVQLLIKGKQKLIKKTEDSGNKISYVDALSLYAKNIDNGRDLVNEIKAIIPLNETIEKNKLSLNTYGEHIQWLIDNVADVDYSKKQYAQKLSNDQKQNGYAKLETIINVKSKTQNYGYEFNFAVLNPNSIDFKIKSEEFYIEVENRRGLKTIKTFENDVRKNYSKSLKFYASSIENGKDIYTVLKAIIPLAQEAFLNDKPSIEAKSNAIDYINKVIANVSVTNKVVSQSLKNDCVTSLNIKTETTKSNEDNVYIFNFIDVNSDNIDYNSQKDLLFVELNINQKNKYIEHVKDGELQNYIDRVKLYVNSVEEAMITKEAIQNMIKACKASIKNIDELSEVEVMQRLKEAIGIVKINDKNYEQSIELMDQEPNVIKLTQIFSNLKKSDEVIYQFGLKDINPKSIVMKTSGKNVLIELSTKYFEKIIKAYEDGQIKSYANKIVIQASSVENGREIMQLFKTITKD